MNIIETNFTFNERLSARTNTKYIILHHRAGNGNVVSIHNQHVQQGYAGIGYHFYIRKDGSVYRGRPIDTIGAHCLNNNSNSIGVCFEGNFERENISDVQLKAGIELVRYLKDKYANVKVVGHKDLYNTVCPGKNFPLDKIIEGANMKELTSVNDIVWELEIRGIITDKELWLNKLEIDENSYWLARKCINYIINQK